MIDAGYFFPRFDCFHDLIPGPQAERGIFKRAGGEKIDLPIPILDKHLMKSLGVEAMSGHVIGHVPFARLQPKWGGFAEHDPWVFGEAFVEEAVEVIDCQVRLPKSRQAYGSIARIPGFAGPGGLKVSPVRAKSLT